MRKARVCCCDVGWICVTIRVMFSVYGRWAVRLYPLRPSGPVKLHQLDPPLDSDHSIGVYHIPCISTSVVKG